MDGDQLIPPPPPPQEPEQPPRRATGFRKIAATAMLCGGLLVGSGIGGFAIAHAAGNASPAATTASSLAASTTTPAATKTPATKPNCPNMGGSSAPTGSSG
jgi:hypothetical protein